MSGYEYAYSVTPARPTGWRSIMAGFVTIVTVVAVSGISGAVVTLELIAPKTPRGDTARDLAVKPSETIGTSDHTASITTPNALTRVQPMVAQDRKQDHKQDQTVGAAALTPATPRAQAPQAVAAAPQAVAPTAAGKSARGIPETDLTFAKGYAQRHAVQEAASAASAPTTHTADGKVAAVSQLGRAAMPHKPAYARYAADPRRQAVRGEATGYYNPYDYRRHEALAYGDERPQRRIEPQGIFGGLFRNN